ncbi:MAG: hypothetical protein R3247_17840 [Rhodothermales bacterium]|nr:hypothetical protein [Rhodothermales bacterium]
MRLLPLLLVLLMAAAGCRTPQGSLTWTGNAPPPDETLPQRTQLEGRPSPSRIPSLTLLDQRAWSSQAGLPAPLTGVNKPEGLALRFRRGVPPETPGFVPRSRGGLDLFLADPVDDGHWLAFYKGVCGSLGDVCRYRAVLHDRSGDVRWDVDLNAFLENDRYVEIQDVRYADGALYFNEACATYAAEAGGQCSSLVRLDPEWRELTWRTPPLVSNNVFILHEDIVIAGYGFTAEPDALYLVDRQTGRLRARTDLDAAPHYLEVQDGRLHVLTYESWYTFDLD